MFNIQLVAGNKIQNAAYLLKYVCLYHNFPPETYRPDNSFAAN